MDKAEKGTFLLGVGAQKAGTSWLHAYLHGRDDADFGFLKEYRVHDARTVPELDPFRHLRNARGISRAWRELALLRQPRTRRRWQFVQHPDRYYDYFERLLSHPGTLLTGDISPCYASLDSDTLAGIRAALEDRAIRVRVVILLRDPIERILSSVRMNLRKKGKLHAEAEIAATRRAAERHPRGMERRGNYRRTLENLDRAFAPEQIHVGFYESLFRPESIRALCRHLGLPYQPADFSRRVNASDSTTTIPAEVMEQLGAWQRDTYQYCLERFREADLARLWPTASRLCR